MDKNDVVSVLESLKSSSSKKIQESLLKIKSLIVNCDKGVELFRDCNGFEYLMPHLLKPNECILNLTLSILGDLCLEQKSCILIGKLDSCGALVTILNTVCRDSILGRTSRLIGNLSRDKRNAENFHTHGVIKALIGLIDNRDKNTSYATLIMAVRAIRKLWEVVEKRSEMINVNLVRCVAVLMTNECETMGLIKSSDVDKVIEEPKRNQKDLMDGILKCIWSFTSYPVATCAEQIQGDGRGYQCLVLLTKTNMTIAMKCLTNLCFLSSCRPLLGMAGLVECLVGILQKIDDVGSWPDGSPMALAQLSGESVNRSRLRRCGGLPLLVTAAKTNSHAMNALLQYVFDDSSFQILIREGLVNLLTDKLTEYVSQMDYDHNVETTGLSNYYHRRPRPGEQQSSIFDIAVKKLSKDLSNGSGSGKKRKNGILPETEDDLKVVIERDNMIVGFVDAIDSDGTGSENEGEPPSKRRSFRRAKSKSPKKKSNLIRMASKDWSAGVYWEPKSPEWPSVGQPNSSSSSPNKETNLPDLNTLYRGPGSREKPQWEWSPESGISVGELSSSSRFSHWSPASESSASPSPYSNDDENSDSEVSGRYSPVCSDDEKEEDLDKTTSSRNAQDEEVIEIDDSEEEEPYIEEGCIGCKVASSSLFSVHRVYQRCLENDLFTSNHRHPVSLVIPLLDLSKIDIHAKDPNIACVMVLLFRVSHGTCTTCGSIRDDPVPNHTMDYLTSRDCLYGLLEYVERCKRPMGRAARILARVLSSELCLMSILRHRLALRLYRMSLSAEHSPEECSQCKKTLKLSSKLLNQLSVLAESSYGIGKISYHLLKGSSSMKQTLALTLPYLVRSEKPLKKYLIDCNGLNLLINIIAESKEEIQDCMIALVKLAHHVNIKDPKLLEKRYRDTNRMIYDPIIDNLPPENVVTFELDDSTTVQANKEFLCQRSEFFSAMLMGKFKESAEKFVRLKNVSRCGLEYLLTLLECGVNNAQCNIRTFPLNPNLKINLEVLILADRFLFEKLKELLSSAILQFQLGPDTADKIYTWSLKDGMGFLCVEAVAYILTGKMSDDDRLESFNNILNLEYKAQFLEDIKSMLLRQLVK